MPRTGPTDPNDISGYFTWLGVAKDAGETIMRMQSHAQWRTLRDDGGRTPFMRALATDADTWRGMRSADLQSLVQARDAAGRSLWFYLAMHPIRRGLNYRRPQDTRDFKDVVQWLAQRLPDTKTSSGEGLAWSFLSASSLELTAAWRYSPRDWWSTSLLQSMAPVVPLKDWWAGAESLLAEQPDRVWELHEGLGMRHDQPRGVLKGMFSLSAIARLVQAYPLKTWRTQVETLNASTRGFLGLTMACAASGTSADTSNAMPYAHLFWADACLPQSPLVRQAWEARMHEPDDNHALEERRRRVWAQMQHVDSAHHLRHSLADAPVVRRARSSRARM